MNCRAGTPPACFLARRAQQAVHCSEKIPGRVAALLQSCRLSNAFRILLLRSITGVEDGPLHYIQCRPGSTTRLLRVLGMAATARQRRSTFIIRIQIESTRRCAFVARDMHIGSNRDGVVSWRDKAPSNGRKACHFFLLSGRIYSAARQTWLQSKIATAQGITPLCQ